MSEVYSFKSLNRILRLELDVLFESGLAVGQGATGNSLEIARDGKGAPYLPGTSIAGVLRAAFRNKYKDDQEFVDYYFGETVESAREKGILMPSRLKTFDAQLLDANGKSIEVATRTSHLRCRHTGRVAESALYSFDSTLPGARATLRFELLEPIDGADEDESDSVIRDLVAFFKRGLSFGGSTDRGVGFAKLVNVRARTYRASKIEDYCAALDDDYDFRSGRPVDWRERPETKALEQVSAETTDSLIIECQLRIPRGQDVLVAGGQGLESGQEPQHIRDASGKENWLLPGSSLRGLFRSYATRLAARDGKKVGDSVEAFEKNGRRTVADEIGWLYREEEKNNDAFLDEIDADYPVDSLFGSLHKAGRLHIADALSPVGLRSGESLSFEKLDADPKFPVQKRAHVALDALSGGALDGRLFDNYVLTASQTNAVSFKFKALVENPTEYDAELLAKTLRALHLGVLRVGSSKASGRLEIVPGSVNAVGVCAEVFQGIDAPEEEGIGEDVAIDDAAKISDAGSAENDEQSAPDADALRGTLKIVATKKEKQFHLSYRNAKGKDLVQRIPAAAQHFDEKDVSDGLEVCYELKSGQIDDVWVPGKRKSTSRVVATAAPRVPQDRAGTVDVNTLPQAPASLIGKPFLNPYTFIPFRQKAAPRRLPAFQTSDETGEGKERFTGVLELELQTDSPLLTRSAVARDPSADQKSYPALAVDQDAIVAATSVRGFLRFLATLAVGAPLTVLEKETYLCQARDLPLPGERSQTPRGTTAILGRVIKAGNSLSSGKIAIGETAYVSEARLQELCDRANINFERPRAGGKTTQYWAEYDSSQASRDDRVVSLSLREDATHKAQIKLSGRPVTSLKGDSVKLEGVFIGELKEIELPPEIWSAYGSRWKNGIRPELRYGDLVWVEPTVPFAAPNSILEAKDVKSIQWARWGRGGTRVDKLIPATNPLTPDSERADGLVALVTDLFGQIAGKGNDAAPSFKGRVAAENLVFEKDKYQLEKDVSLAVMSSPHLSCVPFYRNNNDSKTIGQKDMLRGYKVYRTAKLAPKEPKPWLYSTQGVYDERGNLTPESAQRVNFRADLVQADAIGTLRIALRAVSREELALLLALCNVPWRLGGGKPLGLGLCKPTRIVLRDETGEEVDQASVGKLDAETAKRLQYWVKTQKPVENMRYPRAVVRNNNKNTRGGMTWFQQNAAMKKKGTGVEPAYVIGELKEQVRALGIDNGAYGESELISGQVLPFIPDEPEQELLYGYDAFYDDRKRDRVPFNRNYQYAYSELRSFDESAHIDGTEKAGENLSQNRETRTYNKQSRNDGNYRYGR